MYATGDTFGGLSIRGAGKDQFLCHSWYVVFILNTKYAQPHPLNTSVSLSHISCHLNLLTSLTKHFSSSMVLFNNRLLSIGCFYLSFAYTRTLFDRGKDFELIMSNSCFVTWDFRFGFVSYVGLNLVDTCHRGIVPELVYEIEYRSDWLFSASMPSVSNAFCVSYERSRKKFFSAET